jgi:Tol biopolymer transport system component
LSADGRYVAFVTWSTNFAPLDASAFANVFVRDREAGTTVRVSVASDGTLANGDSYEPVISADGRFVAFTSDATNLVGNDTNKSSDIFLRDLVTGTTTMASIGSDGEQGNSGSSGPAISADGRYVVFESYASNLVAGDTNQQTDVFLRDLQAGTTERISVSAAGVEALGESIGGAVSDDGRFVAYSSTAGNLVSPVLTNSAWHIFVRDRMTGTVTCASVSTAGTPGDRDSLAASMSADGRYVAFESLATNLVNSDTNGRADIFVRDLVGGTSRRVSVDASGNEANGASTHPSLSADGRFIAFVSSASNLAANDTNGVPDVFVCDQQLNVLVRVSIGSSGAQADAESFWAMISRDGRFVAFPSNATMLVPGDTNAASDVFMHGPLF